MHLKNNSSDSLLLYDMLTELLYQIAIVILYHPNIKILSINMEILFLVRLVQPCFLVTTLGPIKLKGSV